MVVEGFLYVMYVFLFVMKILISLGIIILVPLVILGSMKREQTEYDSVLFFFYFVLSILSVFTLISYGANSLAFGVWLGILFIWVIFHFIGDGR